jgi:diacylglycerol kinase (ATP)
MNDRRFVNVSAGGFVADVSDAVDPRLKSLAGKLAYLVGGASIILDHQPGHVTLRCPGIDSFEQEFSLFAVCNSRLVGGGRLIAPHALIDDGLLDVCIVAGMAPMELVAMLRRVGHGEHVEDERVRYFQVPELELDFDRPTHVNTDGEVVETTRCVYRTEPGAARFLTGDVLFAAGRSGTPA